MRNSYEIDLDKFEGFESEEAALDKNRIMRKEFMTDYEIEEADHFIDYFRESWFDKAARDLFSEWQLIDTYWEGDVNLPEFDDDPGSNTNIVDPNVEGRVALFLDSPMEAKVDPIEIGDIQYQEEAQPIIDFILEKNRLNKKREMMYRRLIKYGTSIVTVIWDFDALDGKGLPVYRSWSPVDVFFDPVIKDPCDIEDSRYIILQTIKSKTWAARVFGEEKAKAIMPNYHPNDTEWIQDEDLGLMGTAADMSYLHLFVFTKDENRKVRLVQMSACGAKLWDSVDCPEWDFLNKYPVFIAVNKQREGTIYGKSSIKDLLPIQDIINELDDQIRYNARLNGNIQKVVGSASGIDPEKWTNEPGLVIEATDPTAWQMVSAPPLNQYIINRRDTAFNERQIVTRFSDSMTGVRQQGVDTATEALALVQTGATVIDKDKTIMQEMLSEATDYAFALVEKYWDTEMAFRVTGNDRFAYIKPSKLTKIPALVPATDEYIDKHRKAALDGNRGSLPATYKPPMFMQQEVNGKPMFRSATFDIRITLGAGIPSSKAFKYQALKESMAMKAIDIKEYRRGIRQLGVLPVPDETEDAILARLNAQADAQAIKDKAAADANMMNAQANMAKAGAMSGGDVAGINASGAINRPLSKVGGTSNAPPAF